MVFAIQFEFAIRLLESASGSSWEQHEFQNLLCLIIDELELAGDEAKLTDLIARCEIYEPETLVAIIEAYGVDGSALIHTLFSAGFNTVFTHVHDLFETGLLHLEESSDRELIYRECENWTYEEKLKFASEACEFAKKKKVCGKFLNGLVEHMEVEEGVGFVFEIVTLDFFEDLKGKLQDFTKEFPEEFGVSLQSTLEEKAALDEEGELCDSDADADGNLAGFIDDGCDSIDNSDQEELVDSENEDEEEEEEVRSTKRLKRLKPSNPRSPLKRLKTEGLERRKSSKSTGWKDVEALDEVISEEVIGSDTDSSAFED